MSSVFYLEKALDQIPRLLGNLDRNKFSPTYGCFHRDYWLDKTSDFPDAVRQFGVHALALVYSYEMPNNIYYKKEKIKDWTIAVMEFWAKIQHDDGSFDEFYPYERGWVGPTAFTMYTVCEAYKLLESEMPENSRKLILKAINKAACFIRKGEAEEDHLANHHAMACLSLWKAYKVLDDPSLLEAYRKAFDVFLTYHYTDEGWSREYDGVDPGYLSATVSFFAKVYKENKDPELYKIIKQSIEFSSYFVYPNGFYGGSLGSRNTLHFYCHGYEVMAEEIPLARSIARKMSNALGEGKLVPPGIISDRYVFYRVPEFLLAYLDSDDKKEEDGLLPYEQKIDSRFFEKSRLYIHSDDKIHVLSNLIKGGVIKLFEKSNGNLVYNDCGIIGKLTNGNVVTSQWVDESYKSQITENGWTVTGNLNLVPSNKLFTPFKNIVFRTVMILTGWNPKLAHLIKGKIRKSLILGQRSTPIKFERKFELGERIKLYNKIEINGSDKFESLSIGDEFFVRYVPQSRYFQSQELDISGWNASPDDINTLNKEKNITKIFEVSI